MVVKSGLLSAGVLVVGLFAVGRIVAWWLGRGDELTPRQKTTYNRLITAILLLLPIGVPLLYRLFPVAYALFPSWPPLALSLLNAAIAATVGVLGLGGALLGLRPFLADRVPIRGELWRRNRIVLGARVGIILFGALAIGPGIDIAGRPLGMLVGVTTVIFAGLVLSGFVALPANCPSIRFGVRRPTEREGTRISDAYERLGISPPDSIEVTVDDDSEQLVVLENGAERVLALSDSLFAAVDADTLAVAIAHSEGRAIHDASFFEKLWVSNLVWATVIYLWAIFMAVLERDLLTELVPGALVLLFSIVITNLLIGYWNRKRIHLTDEYTLEHTSSSCLMAVYHGTDQRVKCIQRRKPLGNNLANSILDRSSPEPGMKNRLAHLGLTGGDRLQQSDVIEEGAEGEE
ncbi:hypothetical protein EGH22_04625 [Halomicroarcula sp. F28]|uniref:hypothetical protein n=1 Tax=Haloarcula salinisoli TaxID=2487746 RepID=UPI001C738167|nr:hypothetical protein [Halomicroarcula salinisoli]MBX0285599.1 hypothetical protein [Halomicroarcula salinisoli]